jgi:hypothetical protein
MGGFFLFSPLGWPGHSDGRAAQPQEACLPAMHVSEAFAVARQVSGRCAIQPSEWLDHPGRNNDRRRSPPLGGGEKESHSVRLSAMRFRSPSPRAIDPQLRRGLFAFVGIVAAALFGLQIYRNNQQRAATAPPVLEVSTPLIEPRIELSRPSATTRAVAEAATEAPPQFDKALLQTVQDDTLGIRPEDAPALSALLDHVRRVPAEDLAATARPDVHYVNLMTEPEQFRGDVVTFTGELWRCQQVSSQEALYEAWVFTSDSGGQPYRILAGQLGDGVRPGTSQRTPVEITGYFFQRGGYDAADGAQLAPVVVAPQIVLNRAALAAHPLASLQPLFFGVVVAVGLILAVTFISFAWGDWTAPRQLPDWRPLSSSAQAAVDATDRRSVGDILRELSERDRFGTSRSTPVASANGRSNESDAIELPTPLPPTRRTTTEK